MTSRNSSLESDIRSTAGDVESLLSNVGEQGRAAARNVQDRVSRALDTAKDRFARVDETVRSTARYAADTTDDFVHHRPWQTAAIAVVFGLVAGYLLTRRR